MAGVHPNPGPRRHTTPEAKAARMTRRRARRAEKREQRTREQSKVEEKKEVVVVTWNVQRMSMGERSKRKARAVAEFATKSGWDAVLLAELWAERSGVVWMGEEEKRVVFVHSKRAGVMLRGELMKAWIEEGMMQKVDERHVSVKVKGLLLTSSYMPVSVRGKCWGHM